MSDSVDIAVDHVSKKYCKDLKQSMRYGVRDISRNLFRLSSHPDALRKDEFWAIDDVSFDLREGETLGVIGPNGSGKTTLLKLLNGIFWPDKGKITVKGKVGALIAVGAGFHPALTGRENIYVNAAILGMTRKEVDAKFDSIVDFADIGTFIDTSVKYYSSGMFVRLGFAVAVHCEPDILLVDEILSVGDSGFRVKCLNKIGEMREQGMTTLIVSHNMQLISSYSDRAILLNNGKATEFANPSDAVKRYNRLFTNTDDECLESICSGNEQITFSDVRYSADRLHPGDSFTMSVQYDSTVDYRNAVVDIKVKSGGEGRVYFQATNLAYDKTIDLFNGSHALSITIERIAINNAPATVGLEIWTSQKKEMLFWWKFAIEFGSADQVTGSNFLNVLYELDDHVV
jgi:homopolymeric O-antigen transport system ATP-binding protein